MYKKNLVLNITTKKRLILILLFVINLLCVCNSQKNVLIDSLKIILQDLEQDSNRVNTLNVISKQFFRLYSYQDARHYAEEALMIAEKLKYKKGIADSYINFGRINFGLFKYSEALDDINISLKLYSELYDKNGISTAHANIAAIYIKQGFFDAALKNQLASLEIDKESGDKDGIFINLGNIGIINIGLGKNSEALKIYLELLKMAEESGDKNEISDCLDKIATLYEKLFNYPEAFKYFLAALKIKEETGNLNAISRTYNNIGNLYAELENYEEALKNYQSALKIDIELNNKEGIAISYHNIANIYQRLNNHSEALTNYLLAIKINKEIGLKNGIAGALNSIGNIYLCQGNYTDAIDNYLNSVKIYSEMKNSNGIALSKYNLGRLYNKLSNYNESKRYLEEALQLAKELDDKFLQKGIYFELSDLTTNMKDYENSLNFYKQYVIIQDSLLNDSNNKTMAEMKAKYETEKKDKEIHQLENEKQIDSLHLIVQQESLNNIEIEKEKLKTMNLYNLQQVELLGNEKKLQQLMLEKKQADYIAQKAESGRKQEQVIVLNKENEIQKLELRKQNLVKNYLIGGIILVSFLAFFIYKNYNTRQKLKLQTLRNKIASDLHDDVGSTLSSISIFSQIAQEQSKETIPLLETIGESSRKMLDAMADIVWTINPENDQFEKIILRMKNFAYELLGAKGINFEFVADEDVSTLKLPMDVRKNLYLIFKEATNNIVKYADASKAMFEIKEEKNNLSLIIRDNGKGFDMNQANEGNGLRNMKKRADEIGARLMIESFPENGTTIQLKIAV